MSEKQSKTQKHTPLNAPTQLEKRRREKQKETHTHTTTTKNLTKTRRVVKVAQRVLGRSLGLALPCVLLLAGFDVNLRGFILRGHVAKERLAHLLEYDTHQELKHRQP